MAFLASRSARQLAWPILRSGTSSDSLKHCQRNEDSRRSEGRGNAMDALRAKKTCCSTSAGHGDSPSIA
eukprot:1406601-Pyramimonas_sp.AAC.1